MTTTAEDPQSEPESPPLIPDYLTSPNAVFSDERVQWRYGKAPDYTKTRKVWAEGKSKNHASGSLEEMVENLVKNWEVEASFKSRLSDWRTIDHENYSFAMGGGAPISAQKMIEVGTYNGIIAPNEYYSPKNSDFASSHKTFKRMMPTFAWEVLEVYSGPPRVAFRWRHWGTMKNDYIGFNDKGEKVTAKAHGGQIDIEGVTAANVDDKLRLQGIQTWMDPLEMFRQIAPKGIVNRQAMSRDVDKETALDTSEDATDRSKDAGETNLSEATTQSADDPANDALPPSGQDVGPRIIEKVAAVQGPMTIELQATEPSLAQATQESLLPSKSFSSGGSQNPLLANKPASPIDRSAITDNHEDVASKSAENTDEAKADQYDAVDGYLATSAVQVHPQPKDIEEAVKPVAGEAVVAASDREETRLTHEEMSQISSSECSFLMNRE